MLGLMKISLPEVRDNILYSVSILRAEKILYDDKRKSLAKVQKVPSPLAGEG
jgi:hypothetical protein